MVRKILKKIICAQFLVSCLLMVACLLIVIADCVNMAMVGEFRILPVLNVVQFKSSGILEEDEEIIVKEVAFIDRLYENGQGEDNLFWRFINISTAIALCNLFFYYFLHLLDVRLPRWSLKMVLFAGGIALLLMVAVRIYIRDCYGSGQIYACYPIADITLKDLFLPIFLLSILTGIKKLLREE